MDSAASTQPDPQSEPVASLPRWVEDAREVLALVSGLITDHKELRNAVPVAPPPRWVEDAREVLALVSGLITEHHELRNAVDALRGERDDLLEALKRLRQEHERQVCLHTSVQEQIGALLAEIKQLVADAKQKRRVAQDTSPFARGLQTLL